MRTILRIIPFLSLLILGTNCQTGNDPNAYLQQVLANLETIESAVYYEQRESWQHGDTTAARIYCRLVKEYNNPADTTIGASFINFDCDDLTLIEGAYDGKTKVVPYHDKQVIVLDDFTSRALPFRPIAAPFFNYTKSIIKYVLTSKDSIDWNLADVKDHYYLKLIINEDRQVEFFGRAHHMPENPYDYGNTTSIYELWISKSDNLPYKVRREMSHDISVTSYSKAEFNTISINDFNMYESFPADYEIRTYGDGKKTAAEPPITGEKAPDWTLTDKDGNNVSLADFKGKVMVIQFTGIGCGPCRASIPFLNKLKNLYSADKFEIIAIETWLRKSASLRNYINRNEIIYTMLNGTDEVINNYRAGRAVPVFFIIDKEHRIKKILNGYGEKMTDEEIIKAINEIL